MAHKILVVDDEEGLVLLMQTNLEFLGYSVVTASDGVEALQQAAAEKPDLVLLDVRMPRKTGWEVCKEMKADPTLKHIPVIFLSAFGQTEDVQKGLQLGAERYMNKSSAPMEVMKVVQEVLAKFYPDGGSR